MLTAAGVLLSAVGASALYLASPNQRATARALPRTLLMLAGYALLIAGLIALLQWSGPATAVFIWVTVATLVWTLVPPIAAWLRQPKDDAR